MTLTVVVTNMCQDGNRGDLAILAGTVRALRRAAPGCSISVAPVEVGGDAQLQAHQRDSAALSDGPLIPSPTPARRYEGMSWGAWAGRTGRAVAAERTRLRVLEADADRAFRGALAGADLVIAKGGSWLFSYPTPQQAVYALRMLHPLRVAQRSGVRTAVLGTSLGPWQVYNRADYARTLGRCMAVVTRERLSHDFALAAGLNNVVAGVDMAYALAPPPGPANAKSGVAITPRSLPFESRAAIERYELAVVSAARRLIDEHGEHCSFATQVDLDLELCHRLVRLVDRPGKASVASHLNDLPLDDLMRWYGERRLLLGTRVHSVILAAMAGTPSVILECDPPKMIGISEQLGLADWRVRAAGPEIERLPEVAVRALDAAATTGGDLGATMAGLRSRALAQTQTLIDQLGQR